MKEVHAEFLQQTYHRLLGFPRLHAMLLQHVEVDQKIEEEVEYEEGKVVSALKKRGLSTFSIALIALGLANLVFSLDSIPAIFGLTHSAYIVTTANIFALMGLRQLYFLLEGLLTRLIFLSRGLSFILAFIGVKMILEALHGNGVHVPEISLEISLGVIILTLVVTAITSLAATRDKTK